MSDVATEVQEEYKKEVKRGVDFVAVALGFVTVVGLLFVLGGYGIAIRACQEAAQAMPADGYNEKAIDAALMIGLGLLIAILAISRIIEREEAARDRIKTTV